LAAIGLSVSERAMREDAVLFGKFLAKFHFVVTQVETAFGATHVLVKERALVTVRAFSWKI
jgi:hypothetical protein